MRKIVGWTAAGVAALTVVVLALGRLAQEKKTEEIVLTPEESTLATAEVELSPVVVTQEPEEMVLTPFVVTAEPTPETLPSVAVTLEPTLPPTEEVFDIYIKPRGACMAIIVGSSCLEYWGDYWTSQTMALHCSSPGTTFIPGKISDQPCPQEDRMGGCRVAKGQPTEYVWWIYRIGGEPFNEATAGDFLSACVALGGEPIP